MSFQHGLKRLWRHGNTFDTLLRRAVHQDGRNRLSNFWTPTQPPKRVATRDHGEDGHDLLLRAGYLRQAHAGIFHLLPLGLRVLDKLERLIDKHMQSLGASKVSLSSISSQDLWRKSGRLEGRDSELFQLKDRKDANYLLSPTHEEEITTIVKNAVHSYKDLPLRLYQVSRKYRDEARPRQGLLRGREFIMKDLYTFDLTEQDALRTYEDARAAYRRFLDDLNMPYLVANADSGKMGGNHSHEYHFISSKGEDRIISCNQCGLCINEELYVGKYDSKMSGHSPEVDKERASGGSYQVQRFRLPDNKLAQAHELQLQHSEVGEGATARSDKASLLQVVLPPGVFELNTHALKKLFPNVNTGEVVNGDMETGNGEKISWSTIVSVRDPRVPPTALTSSHNDRCSQHSSLPIIVPATQDIVESPFLLTKAGPDDPCPECGAMDSLAFQQAVEIGHTFHLGKRYSTPLEATVQNEHNELVEMQMGCHGVGVSRLLGAVATLLADERGLNWPVRIAPFGVLVLGTGKIPEDDVIGIYDQIISNTAISMDAVIDDRERPVGWKLNDADLIGYPFIIVLGKAWNQHKVVELQCRRLKVREEVPYERLTEKLIQYSKSL